VVRVCFLVRAHPVRSTTGPVISPAVSFLLTGDTVTILTGSITVLAGPIVSCTVSFTTTTDTAVFPAGTAPTMAETIFSSAEPFISPIDTVVASAVSVVVPVHGIVA
jgi:hypothetical protein